MEVVKISGTLGSPVVNDRSVVGKAG